jgi:hypothetical protein
LEAEGLGEGAVWRVGDHLVDRLEGDAGGAHLSK